MRKHLPSSIQIKASGGIRDYAFAKELVEAGAEPVGMQCQRSHRNRSTPEPAVVIEKAPLRLLI